MPTNPDSKTAILNLDKQQDEVDEGWRNIDENLPQVAKELARDDSAFKHIDFKELKYIDIALSSIWNYIRVVVGSVEFNSLMNHTCSPDELKKAITEAVDHQSKKTQNEIAKLAGAKLGIEGTETKGTETKGTETREIDTQIIEHNNHSISDLVNTIIKL